MAAIVASFVMFGVGVAYRVLAGDVLTAEGTIAVDAAVLNRLPMQIGDWVGQEVAVDERIMQATGGDAHINRQYSRRGGLESISLYIVLGTNTHDIMSHRPLGCYRASGWTLIGRDSAAIPLSSGPPIPSLIYQFYREGTPSDKVTVLHYCYADGKYFDEVMKVLSEGWRGLRSIGYAAQVQVIAFSQTLTDDAGIQLVTDFTVDSAAVIAELLARIEEDRISSQSGGSHEQ